MMMPLEAPDSIHLQAAEGWVGLGNYADANDELEQIAAANRAHHDVLQIRWRIYADARKWDAGSAGFTAPTPWTSSVGPWRPKTCCSRQTGSSRRTRPSVRILNRANSARNLFDATGL
jgi:hypothetical protein